MKVFVWQRIENCTDRYHSEGGVVVFAHNEVQARELVFKESEGKCVIPEGVTPDEARECGYGPSCVFIMPDAGCC